MGKTIYLDCPFCEGMMEVDIEKGKIVNKWAPGEKESADTDKMSSALKKMEDAKKKRASLFEQTKGDMANQKKKLEDSFKKEVERIKREGLKDKPSTPFDLD